MGVVELLGLLGVSWFGYISGGIDLWCEAWSGKRW